MKNFLGIALILGITMISCSKDKTNSTSNSDTMTTSDVTSDTSMALQPSDTATMNASAPERTDSANVAGDSAVAPVKR
ncbi:hypothetical protein [Chryseobacterium sp.]|uniref:hypothetical protein n=1 Tax=Chryseobacterium sp. TaxID=1871047 RepID=UPI0028A241CE|nr:hypothetical protein [Chryseobacterium sp.]